jgi:hypothetical protein
MHPPGFYRDRAREQEEFAREIGEALRVRDHVRARDLIEEARHAGFSHAAMIAAVEEEANQGRNVRP